MAVTPSLRLAGELEADDFGEEHRLRLAEHGGFGFDAADAPAEDGEAVDHRRVAVGADEGVGIGDGGAVGGGRGPDDLGEIFEVHLVADAGAGRDDAEVLEGALAPLEEGVAFAVALVFQRDVVGQRFGRAELIDDDGMVDDEIDGDERVDLLGVAAELEHAVAHGGEIDHGGDAGEVLHQHAGGAEADFLAGLAFVIDPFHGVDDVLLGDGAAIFGAEQVLDQHLHGEGQLGEAREAIFLRVGERIIAVGLAAGGQRLAALEAVEGKGGGDDAQCRSPRKLGR